MPEDLLEQLVEHKLETSLEILDLHLWSNSPYWWQQHLVKCFDDTGFAVSFPILPQFHSIRKEGRRWRKTRKKGRKRSSETVDQRNQPSTVNPSETWKGSEQTKRRMTGVQPDVFPKIDLTCGRDQACFSRAKRSTKIQLASKTRIRLKVDVNHLMTHQLS